MPHPVHVQRQRHRAGGDGLAAQREAEHRPGLRREQRAARALEVEVRVRRRATVRVDLEVEVVVSDGVAGVSVPGDLLAGRDLCAVRDGVGVLATAAAVVEARGHVVVQVDVHVRRTAAAVEIEHAAAERRLAVLDTSGLDGDHGRAPGRLDVDAGVHAVGPGIAVAVPPERLRDEREHDPRDAVRASARGTREDRGGEAEENEHKGGRAGCRPVRSHSEGSRCARRSGR